MADRVLEDLARLFCEQDDFNPDDRMKTTDIKGNPAFYPRWKEYMDLARQAYQVAHR